MSLQGLEAEVHASFPLISQAADRRHEKHWGDLLPDDAYMGFESLANALNDERRGGMPAAVHRPLLGHLEDALGRSDEVDRCIDVAFVEKLFWQVGGERAAPYWESMPGL